MSGSVRSRLSKLLQIAIPSDMVIEQSTFEIGLSDRLLKMPCPSTGIEKLRHEEAIAYPAVDTGKSTTEREGLIAGRVSRAPVVFGEYHA